MIRLTIINPNTSAAMTEKIGHAARSVAAPDTEIRALCPGPLDGPAAIESHSDEIRAAAAVQALIQDDLARGGSDGYIIACFGDPGLDAARELVDVPVIGVAEAAMHVAMLAGRTFGIVTTLSRTLGRARDIAHRYGADGALVAAYGSGLGVLELEDTRPEAYERILGWCRTVVEEDEADVVVLGCAGMADLCHRLSASLGVPVVDGVAAAVGLASGMARMGVGTSKRDEYAHPPLAPRVRAAETTV